MKHKIAVFWFRRDLRLEDNKGLHAALTSGIPVLPIFIFDENILSKIPKLDARLEFIHLSLSKIQQEMQGLGKALATFHSTPLKVFEQLASQYNIQKVVANRDYEPYATQRDALIEAFLNQKSIDFETHKDHVVFEKSEIVKDDGSPYKVYTPFANRWMTTVTKEDVLSFSSEKHLDKIISHKHAWLSLNQLGFRKSGIKTPRPNTSSTLIDLYEAKRNFPAIEGTSKLGPHLRFGTVSIRKMVKKAQESTNPTFLKELIWREFFQQILWHFPHTKTQSFKPQYDRIEWRNNESEFLLWCKGKTGYPLVDAGMRELNKTGFMHNRVRMLVGSFLCKHLLIDWRWGEAYFAEKLLDYEMASNIGNWQWVAGCGVDAAPYFRVFNPSEQIKKFDKTHEYIKKWVPEYQELTYPQPMVDHKMARERCLAVYKKALQ